MTNTLLWKTLRDTLVKLIIIMSCIKISWSFYKKIAHFPIFKGITFLKWETHAWKAKYFNKELHILCLDQDYLLSSYGYWVGKLSLEGQRKHINKQNINKCAYFKKKLAPEYLTTLHSSPNIREHLKYTFFFKILISTLAMI